MSVAEALGQEVRTPSVEVRRQKHFIGFNNDQPRLIPYEASPRYAMSIADQFSGGHASKDFRLKGYTEQGMLSPRIPRLASIAEDRKKNEQKLLKYFGKPSLFDPTPSDVKEPQSRREPLALRKLEDIYSNRGEEDLDRMRRERKDMEDEMLRIKEKHSREIQDKENERKQNYELSTNFVWDQRSSGHGGPNNSGNYRRKQFLETNSGPFYDERKEGEPTSLGLNIYKPADGPSAFRPEPSLPQRQDFKLFDPSQRPEAETPFELQAYSRKLNQVSEQKKLLKQQQSHPYADVNSEFPIHDFGYNNFDIERFPDEKRSLDLDHTRGGGGAPVKDERGKSVTRRPITLSRDNYGETRIREEFARTNTGNSSERERLYSRDNKPYFPWGSQGGGAPIRDREGRIITQVFGKLEGKDLCLDNAQRRRKPQNEDYIKDKLRKGVFFNELKEVEKQQKENKEELKSYMKAPQAEITDLLAAGRVGKPRRDEVTGYIAQQHLPHSDVSKVKTNYQPKPVNEKKQYHDELVRMAEERQYKKLLDKFKERQESNAHFQNMDSSWGQFGGGAPKHQVIRKKVNLTNALFYPEQGSGQASSQTTARTAVQEEPAMYPSYQDYPPTGLGSFEFAEHAHHNAGYQKRYPEDDQRQFHSPENSPRYVKNTINSSHRNLYQSNNDLRLSGVSGQTVPPFATGML